VSDRLFRALRHGLWVIPLGCLLVGIGLSFLTLAIDRAHDYRLISQDVVGDATSSEIFLSTTAATILTLASLVLSLTLVAVQVAMGQFSPRIVRAIFADRGNQLAVGLFGGTFAFQILILRQIHDPGQGPDQVPGLSILIAYVLTIASLVALFLYVQHAAKSLRVAGLVDLVGDNTRDQLDRWYQPASEKVGPRDPDDAVVVAPDSGNVVFVDEASLVDAACEADCRLELVPAMGDFVAAGTAMLRIHGDDSSLDQDRVSRFIRLAPERTHEDDPAFGFRKLVDIAERSVADPFDDPTTAVQAIDRLHDCLGMLAERPFPTGEFHDDDGELRLVTPTMTWAGYVRLAFHEVTLAGAGSPQITRRLRATLEDLKAVAPPDRHQPLDAQMEVLESAVRNEVNGEEEARFALVPDRQGIGSGDDMVARHSSSSSASRSR
jgi:uncharacterized membrane protein